MSLPPFDTEKTFRQQWIAPFLSRVGYILPKHVHGCDEQGKDFFFAEHDRFGHVRINAAQAKIGNIGAGKDISALWDQIQRCFEITLKYHHGAHERRISSVYIFTTGTISAQAREQIWDQARLKSYGENVFFLDGETLENLNRDISYRSDRDSRTRLVALADEIAFNARILDRLMKMHSQGKQGFKSFVTIALEESLRTSISSPSLGALREIWLLLKSINDRYQPVPGMDLFEQKDFDSWQSVTNQARAAISKAALATSQAIEQLDESLSLEFEIVVGSAVA